MSEVFFDVRMSDMGWNIAHGGILNLNVKVLSHFVYIFQTLRMLKYSRAWSSEAHAKTEGEIKLGRVLSEKFPKASFIHVEDISGILK